LRGIACSNRDGRFLIRVAETLGGLRDADERCAEVALDVDGERFDRRYIKDAAACFFFRLSGGLAVGRKHQAVDAPEKCGESFASAGRREDQRRFATRDRGPAEDLWARGSGEDGGEPVADGGMEEIERVRGRKLWRRSGFDGRRSGRFFLKVAFGHV
jgi:hypothetical protein